MDTLQGSFRVESYRIASDVSLENRIDNYLYHRHFPGCEGIQTMAKLGTVVVRGKLPSRHSKWLCIQCCRRVAGVIHLIDQLVVNHKAVERRGHVRLRVAARKDRPSRRLEFSHA